MEVKYNVIYKFKKGENKTEEDFKTLFNQKWLNVILTLENNRMITVNQT